MRHWISHHFHKTLGECLHPIRTVKEVIHEGLHPHWSPFFDVDTWLWGAFVMLCLSVLALIIYAPVVAVRAYLGYSGDFLSDIKPGPPSNEAEPSPRSDA